MKTYTEWARAGRQVNVGEKAQFFAMNPNPEGKPSRYGLFSEDQTGDRVERDESWPIIPVDELPPIDSRKKLRVDVNAEGFVTVWCGPDAKIIELMQRKKWTFHAPTRRWVGDHKNPLKTAAALESKGYNVIVADELLLDV